MGDKLRGKVDQATGKIKEGVGKATDNESLEMRERTTSPKAM
jgi:uncharacterized protein YjbJ (UPF0337 family)